jgi:hypothetical protein
MKSFILLLFLCFTFSQAEAQVTDLAKVKYISSVYLLGNEIPLKGAIVTTGDSTIQLIDKSLLKSKAVIAPDLIQVIPIASVNRIDIRRKNSVGRGALRGLLGGAAFGAIFGFAIAGNDNFFSRGESAQIGVAVFTIPGLITGTLVGANKKTKIKINGNPASYALNREKIKKYTLTGH